MWAGPKSPSQWKDGRSAKECARTWVSPTGLPGIPDELLATLGSHPDFGSVLEWEGEPECLVTFDEYGGPANVDVFLSVRDEHGPFVVAVEAKADETFGPLVGRALTDAIDRKLANAASKGYERIEALAAAVLGPRAKGAPPLHQIRYQLLTASAAALTRAKSEGASRAVVIVHEFKTRRTEDRNLKQNQKDLSRFVARLGIADPGGILTGGLVGPVHVPGGGRFFDPPPLYIGKATRRVLSVDDG